MRLADCVTGRDNNFNLVRIIAAFGVMVSHCWPLTRGHGVIEPPGILIGMSFGSIAVDLFFVTSGFLVTGSLLSRQDTLAFVWARALRIFPAMFVMLLVTVSILGLFFSTVSPSAFFTDSITLKYFWRCLTLINGLEYELPGVFAANPYENIVNGSLWSMRYEVRLYLVLALVWFILHFVSSYRLLLFRIMVVAGAIGYGLLTMADRFSIYESSSFFPQLAFMFLMGGSFFILREHIILSGRLAIALCALLALAAAISFDVFFVVYCLSLAYLLLYVSYIPKGVIRRYNALGDYSYGAYIYAFPVQQAIVSLVPGITVMPMLVLSSVFTLTLAMLSWHLVEEPALKLKDYFGRRNKLQSRV